MTNCQKLYPWAPLYACVLSSLVWLSHSCKCVIFGGLKGSLIEFELKDELSWLKVTDREISSLKKWVGTWDVFMFGQVIKGDRIEFM